MLFVSTIVLTIALVVKFFMFTELFNLWKKNESDEKAQEIDIYKISLLTLVIFSIPSLQYLAWGKYYSGQIVPNVWHNSTTMFSMPVAIYIIKLTFENMNKTKIHILNILYLLFLLAISIFIKPSFAFIYIPTIILFVIMKRINKKFILIAISGVFLILIQYYIIYLNSESLIYSSKSTIGLDFFGVWSSGLRNYSFLIFPALIMSILFPLTHFLLNAKRLVNNIYYQFILVSNGFAYFLFIFISEHGPRFNHGNFYWQLVFSTSLLFAYNIYDYYCFPNRNVYNHYFLKRLKKMEYYILSSHILSGIFYILLVIFLGKYK